MRTEPAIGVEGISKRYCRSLKKSLWYGIWDIGNELSGRGQQADRLRPAEFWALKDVSFDVARGESVGLIGHNGAGKTTLLKLINGLVKPSAGKITVRGSVRALIALGAGFNPVLTGRENIRVASAVLGFSEQETRDQFDAIIEFSELEEFIDAPVQSYSSGMLARLGFAVAVHTRPDILLVDEVLAVGDLRFGMKCFQKIGAFRAEGGAILLVSHNPYTIRTNCDRVVWLEHGKVREIGDVSEVCDAYELEMGREAGLSLQQRHSDGTIRVSHIDCPNEIGSGDGLNIRVTLESERTLTDPIIQVSFTDVGGQHVAVNDSLTDGVDLRILRGENSFELSYPSLPLRPGIYTFNVAVSEQFMTNLRLMDLGVGRIEVRRERDDHPAGVLALVPRWHTEPAVMARDEAAG
ncbi:MAG TPA: ABC transporter ATP-binding protein [Gaiellaceae bacterium]|nr:ABC transporter ATP-binding protein [Gaiellaceae bacterium]